MRTISLRAGLLIGALAFAGVSGHAERNVLVQLDYSLREAKPRSMPSASALGSLTAGEKDQARHLVRLAFTKNWVTARGGLKLEHLELAAGPLAALGEGNKDLPGLMAGDGTLPAAAADDGFIEWARGALPSDSVRLVLLPTLGKVAPRSAQVVDRLRFLQRLARAGERDAVQEHFDRTYWKPAPVGDSAVYFNALADNPIEGWDKIRTQLAEQCYAKPVADWSEAGDTLVPMSARAQAGTSGFLKKAAGRLQTTSADRNDGAIMVLTRLALPLSASEGSRIVGLQETTCALDWFVWCHGSQKLIEHLLADSAAARDLSARLVAFCAPDDDTSFRKLFSLVRDPYYAKAELSNGLFRDLLAPKVAKAGLAAGLVLGVALDGGWTTEHRHELGVLTLKSGPERDPAWKSATRSRLETADLLFRNLGDTDQQAHVERPLLERVLKGHLTQFIKASDSDNDQELQAVETGFMPLVDHLRGCRRAGANLSGSSPLKEFRARLAESVIETFEKLSAEEGRQGRVRLFVRRFKLALKVDQLIPETTVQGGAAPPGWVRTVCGGLRSRVFGFPAEYDAKAAVEPRGAVIRWTDDALKFRGEVLCEISLDEDFRKAVRESKIEDLVFQEILVPLVRVYGLIAALRERNPSPYPEWCAKDPTRWEQMFEALDTAESLNAELAVKAYAMRHLASLGVSNPWVADASQFFAKRWSVNASFAVFRGLLRDSRPEANAVQTGATKLTELANLAAEHWRELPANPAREASGWLEHLITAAEWQQSPFLSSSGDPLRWDNPVGEGDDQPFRFQVARDPWSVQRRVDGKLRLLFTRHMLSLTSLPTAASQLEFLADAASTLPNSEENDATPDGGRAGDEVKVAAARLVHASLSGTGGDRFGLLRSYMRLGAALTSPAGAAGDPQGAMPQELPPPLTLLTNAPDAASPEMASLREELRRLLQSRERRAGPVTKDLLRLDVDGMLGTLDKQGSLLDSNWGQTDRDLRARDFGGRLLKLGDTAIRDFLRLRRTMVQLLGLSEQASEQGHVPSEPPTPNSQTPSTAPDSRDAERVQRFFSYIDSLIFYSRPDWKRNNGYLTHEKADPKPWWPALTILCAATPEFQDEVLRFVKSVPVETGRLNLLDLFRLNEAAIGTISNIVAGKDKAAEMLGFIHEIRWTELNLRLLARFDYAERADARTLVGNAFSGAVRNVAIASRLQTTPDDAVVEGRLFASLDAGFADGERRGDPIISLDGAVRLAARCAEDTTLPPKLAQAAPLLLEAATSAPDSAGLLAGAATPGLVLDILFRLQDLSGATPSPFYRRFYDRALTAGPRLAPAVYRAIAQPFFIQTLPGQRVGIDAVVDHWRAVATAPPPANPSQLATVCRASWGPLINQLLKGNGRKPTTQPYLWQAVEALQAATERPPGAASTQKAPAEFMALVAWLQGHWRENDPQVVRDFFDPLAGAPPQTTHQRGK